MKKYVKIEEFKDEETRAKEFLLWQLENFLLPSATNQQIKELWWMLFANTEISPWWQLRAEKLVEEEARERGIKLTF